MTASASGLSRRTILTSDGLCLSLEDSGHWDHVYLLLHGFGEGGYVWDQFTKQLEAHKRVVIVDLRGHGNSDWVPSGIYPFDHYVDDVVKVIDELGLQRITLVGHSLGGLIALKTADLRRNAIDRLVIMESSPEHDLDAEMMVRSFLEKSLKTYPTVDDHVTWTRSYRPLVSMETARRVALGALRPGPDGGYVLRIDPAILNRNNLRQEGDNNIWQCLSTLSVPSLIMRGEWSGVLSRQMAERMRDRLPGGKMISIQKAGHGLMLDNPHQFLSELIRFTTELEPQ